MGSAHRCAVGPMSCMDGLFRRSQHQAMSKSNSRVSEISDAAGKALDQVGSVLCNKGTADKKRRQVTVNGKSRHYHSLGEESCATYGFMDATSTLTDWQLDQDEEGQEHSPRSFRAALVPRLPSASKLLKVVRPSFHLRMMDRARLASMETKAKVGRRPKMGFQERMGIRRDWVLQVLGVR